MENVDVLSLQMTEIFIVEVYMLSLQAGNRSIYICIHRNLFSWRELVS